jgi:hypothetical protein
MLFADNGAGRAATGALSAAESKRRRARAWRQLVAADWRFAMQRDAEEAIVIPTPGFVERQSLAPFRRLDVGGGPMRDFSAGLFRE